MDEIKNKRTVVLNRLKLLSIEMLIVLLAFLISMVVVILIIKEIIFKKKDSFDDAVFHYLEKTVSDQTTSVMKFFTIFGGQYFLIPAYLFLIFYFFFIRKNKWLCIKITAVSLSSLVLMFLLKTIFQRPRPMIPLLKAARGLSFPSGHAFMSFSFFGLLIFIIHKEIHTPWLKYLLILLMLGITFTVGLSRIYLRVHYASDVVAGFSMGFMWIVMSMSILRAIEKNNTSLPDVQ